MPYKDKEKQRKMARLWSKMDRLKNPEKWRRIAHGKYMRHRTRRLEYAKKYRKEHPDLIKQATSEWRKKNREKVLATRKRWYKKYAPSILEKYKNTSAEYRRKVLLHYGGNPPKCSCCGESYYQFLTIEHTEGGGGKHRKKIGATNMTRWIVKNNYPKEFDVLCYNCNCAKGYLGICPHKQKLLTNYLK